MTLSRRPGRDLKVVDAEQQFLDALAGIAGPEEKGKIIRREFIRTFQAAEADVVAESVTGENAEKVAFLVLGTLYPDVAESGGPGASNIKSHHHVRGFPTTWSSSSSSRCTPCSRTRCG